LIASKRKLILPNVPLPHVTVPALDSTFSFQSYKVTVPVASSVDEASISNLNDALVIWSSAPAVPSKTTS